MLVNGEIKAIKKQTNTHSLRFVRIKLCRQISIKKIFSSKYTLYEIGEWSHRGKAKHASICRHVFTPEWRYVLITIRRGREILSSSVAGGKLSWRGVLHNKLGVRSSSRCVHGLESPRATINRDATQTHTRMWGEHTKNTQSTHLDLFSI